MKTRIKEHDNTYFDTGKGKTVFQAYYTVQYKRGLFWRTVARLGVLGGTMPVRFQSRRAAEKCRKYVEQTGRTMCGVWGRLP